MAQMADVAHDMEIRARRNGAAIVELSRGLRLELVWVGGQKTLTMARPATKPSDEEVSICRFAFGVPLEAQRDDGLYMVTLRWPS